MSERHRSVAGAPERSAEEATSLIVEMLTATLEPAGAVDPEIVTNELAQARAAMRMLVAGKHLAQTPLVLVADPLRLEITVLSGNEALTLNENLGKVPGAVSATDWTLHVPAPAPISTWVEEALAGLEHVSTVAPTSKSTSAGAVTPGTLNIDPDALRRVAGAR